MRRSKSEKIRVQPELIRRSGGGVALTREVLESICGGTGHFFMRKFPQNACHFAG